MISEEDRWLYQYTLPCTGGIPEIFYKLKKSGKFNESLRDLSRESVRDYFMRQHNLDAYLAGNYWHMLFPYIIADDDHLTGLLSKLFSFTIPPEFSEKSFGNGMLSTARKLGVLKSRIKRKNMLYVHGDFIVDVV